MSWCQKQLNWGSFLNHPVCLCVFQWFTIVIHMLTVGSDLSSLSKRTAADKSSIADSSVAAALLVADRRMVAVTWCMLVNSGACW